TGFGCRSHSSAAAEPDSTAPNPGDATGLAPVHSDPRARLEARSAAPLTPFNKPNAVPWRRVSTSELVNELSTEVTTGFCAPTRRAMSPSASQPWPISPTTHAAANVTLALARIGDLPPLSADHPPGRDTAAPSARGAK